MGDIRVSEDVMRAGYSELEGCWHWGGKPVRRYEVRAGPEFACAVVHIGRAKIGTAGSVRKWGWPELKGNVGTRTMY